MIKDLQGVNIEIDMIQGNINRMCVTDNVKELGSMREWAVRRIEAIYKYNCIRLEKEDEHE